MASNQQKPPPGLGTDGRKLWREITAPLTDDELELTPARASMASFCGETEGSRGVSGVDYGRQRPRG